MALGLLAGACTPTPAPTAPRVESAAPPAYWDALRRFDPGAAEAAAPTEGHATAARALGDLRAGLPEEALARYAELLANEDPELHRIAVEGMGQLLFTLGRNEELALHLARNGGSADNRVLANAFARLEPESIRFAGNGEPVPFVPSFTGTPVVQAQVDGRGAAMWLDTGAATTVLSETLAKDLGVEPIGEEARAGTATERSVQVRPARLRTLIVGGVVASEHRVVIVSDQSLTFTSDEGETTRIQGIIGWNFLRHVDLRVDYGDRSVEFREPGPAPPDTERNLFWFGAPIVEVREQSGMRLHFMLDTGSNRTWLSRQLLARLDLGATHTRAVRAWGAGGSELRQVEVVDFIAFEVGDYTFRLRQLDVLPVEPVLYAWPDGVLGTDIAQGGSIRVDATAGIFTYWPAGSATDDAG